MVFSSATPAPAAPKATFEGDANDNSDQFELDENFVVTSLAANHTTSGSKVVKMNQTYKIGPAKSLKVYPGDKVDMEVWEYHEGSSGFGTSTTGASVLINLIATAFGGVSGGGGESQAIYDGVSEAVTGFGAGGGNQGSNRPAAYINYLLFDKDYNPLDMGYTVVPDVTFTKQQLTIPTLNIEEEGYVFVYLSYDNDSPNWVYFDDFKVTHTKSNVIQYNEYYPFGLQTSNSWTRESNENNFLYNAGSEINTTSGLYDLPFRNYDASLGRFFQVDPLAHLDNSTSPFAYGANNPVYFNDPMGLQASGGWSEYNRYAVPTNREDAMRQWGNEWSNDAGNFYVDPGGYGAYVEYRYYWKTDGNGKEYDDRVEAEYKRHIEYEWIEAQQEMPDNSYEFEILHSAKDDFSWDWFVERQSHGNMRYTETAVMIFYNTNPKDAGTPEYGKVIQRIQSTRYLYSNASGFPSREMPYKPSRNMQSWIDAAIEYHAFNGKTVFDKYIDFILSPKNGPKRNRMTAVTAPHN